VRHDWGRDDRVYYCDIPIGGKFSTLDEACDAAMECAANRKHIFLNA